jgi:hypothetical protein
MYEWPTNFSSFAALLGSDRSLIGTDAVYFCAVALTSLILAARIAARNGGLLKRLSGRLFFRKYGAERHQIALSALKACPKCADQLPLSALVCDGCEYNFLSGTVGSRHKLLPGPNVASVNG